MITLIYDTCARLPGILEFCVESDASCLWNWGPQGQEEAQSSGWEARRSRCVQCSIDSCVLPVIDSVRLGGSVAGLTLSTRRLCGEQGPWNIPTPLGDPCRRTR